MTEKKRLANIELLRVLAMVMVVAMHFVRESGSLLLAETEVLSARYMIATLLEAFCIVAVNVYVFISGYYGTESSFKLSKVMNYLCRIWFYALLIPLVLICLGVPTVAQSIGIYGVIQYVLPISSEHYWFASSYFYLLLLMPLLNHAVKAMEKRQLTAVTTGLLVVFCGIKSIVPVELAFDRYGYDLFWFVCVYLVAAWLKLYGSQVEEKLKKYGAFLYVGSCLLIFGMTLGLWKLIPLIGGIAYYFTVPFHYNFILCLTGAVGLFYTFVSIDIKEGKAAKIIRKAGKYCFGVYLLHEHLDVRHLWYQTLTGWMKPLGLSEVTAFVAGLLVCVVLIFVAGICIDFIRDKLFGVICGFVKKEG